MLIQTSGTAALARASLVSVCAVAQYFSALGLGFAIGTTVAFGVGDVPTCFDVILRGVVLLPVESALPGALWDVGAGGLGAPVAPVVTIVVVLHLLSILEDVAAPCSISLILQDRETAALCRQVARAL